MNFTSILPRKDNRPLGERLRETKKSLPPVCYRIHFFPDEISRVRLIVDEYKMKIRSDSHPA